MKSGSENLNNQNEESNEPDSVFTINQELNYKNLKNEQIIKIAWQGKTERERLWKWLNTEIMYVCMYT